MIRKTILFGCVLGAVGCLWLWRLGSSTATSINYDSQRWGTTYSMRRELLVLFRWHQRVGLTTGWRNALAGHVSPGYRRCMDLGPGRRMCLQSYNGNAALGLFVEVDRESTFRPHDLEGLGFQFLCYAQKPPAAGWRFGLTKEDRDFAANKQTSVWSVKMPIWMAFTVFSLYPVTVFLRGPAHRYWRVRNGRCTGCGYDLTGNVTGVCSECGRAVSS